MVDRGDGALLQAAGISHSYGATPVLRDVGFDVSRGELLTILGPSGSGKTSLLRVLGGFEMPDTIAMLRIDGVDLRHVPAQRRPTATVFQHYALFPHLSVGENVEYGLRVRGVGRTARRRKAQQALELLHLPDKYDRAIRQLSGGERQRVAFARALVTEPLVLLLDEPMGALDERLRKQLETEIRALQQSLGMTIIQVTHSRDEALSMSDRIAVMRRGRIEQVGTPAQVFERPATRFIAEFMGLANIVTGHVVGCTGDLAWIDCRGTSLCGTWTGRVAAVAGHEAFLAVHPERIAIGAPDSGAATVLHGRCRAAGYEGVRRTVQFETEIGPIRASMSGRDPVADDATIHWRAEDAVVGPLGDRLSPGDTS